MSDSLIEKEVGREVTQPQGIHACHVLPTLLQLPYWPSSFRIYNLPCLFILEEKIKILLILWEILFYFYLLKGKMLIRIYGRDFNEEEKLDLLFIVLTWKSNLSDIFFILIFLITILHIINYPHVFIIILFFIIINF